MKITITLAVLCGVVVTASAQHIQGRVIDAATSEPLPGVSVLLKAGGNKIAGYTFSDAKGAYSVSPKAAQADSLYLEFSLLGYAKQQRKITATHTTYDVALEMEAINSRQPELSLR